MDRSILALSLLVMLIFGCGNDNKSLIDNAPFIATTLKDDLGRTVILKNTPQKVISLAPNITEMIFAMGAEDKLIATSQACDYPEEANEYQKITTYPGLDFESLLMLEPDLVLGTNEIFSESYVELFDKFHLPLYFQTYGRTEDIYRNITVLGKILNVEENAAKLRDSLETIEKKIVAATENQVKYGTLVLIDHNPLTVVGRKSYINEMVEKAGGKNALENLQKRYGVVSAEAILKSMPEVLILPTKNEDLYGELMVTHPILANIPAAINNRVFIIDPDLVYRPGPRAIEGLIQMTSILHSKINAQEFLHEE